MQISREMKLISIENDYEHTSHIMHGQKLFWKLLYNIHKQQNVKLKYRETSKKFIEINYLEEKTLYFNKFTAFYWFISDKFVIMKQKKNWELIYHLSLKISKKKHK